MPQNIFKIYDGRTSFWQWDTGQKLIVLDDSIDQVHFSTKDMTHALVSEVHENEDGIRVCSIPDIILTLPKNLVAYAYVLDSGKTRTVRSVKFPVIPRPIPDNYISNQNDEIEDLTNRVMLLESMFSNVEFKQFDTFEEAEQWAKESQESGIVVAVNINSRWVVHMIEDDYSVVPVCNCDEKALIGDIAALQKLVGETPVADQIADAIALIMENPDEVMNSINELVALVQEHIAAAPKMTTITLLADAWDGETSPYSQVVIVNGVTKNSKIDLQPTATQIVELQDAEISLTTENNAGIITVWAIGDKPTVDYTMQALITEVTPV